jgi:N-methylhydantoinase B
MTIDPITLSVLWSRLIATVDEQAAALMRSSFSSIVREAGDLACGVFDRRGRMVAQSVTGTPGHINPMATCMHHFLERFPLETLAPGDVLLTNDPWKTASQLNDITVATPVFKDGRVIALFANCCHALDIGGKGLSADALSVFEEGIWLPVMKLYDRGRPVQPVLDILAANVRTPDEVLGDLHSQVTANEVGARQLLAFLAELDLPDIEALSDAIVERSERAMRERIAALPDGRHTSTITVDGFGTPITIACAVTIAGDTLAVDFTGTSGTVERGINVALNYTRGYTTYGVKCAISPDVPNNEGSFRPVTVTAPEGSIVNARFPAPVAGRHLVGHFLPSAVMAALAGALPDRVIAPGADALWDTHLAGERADGGQFSFTWFSCGGTGALSRKDGLSATAFPSGIAGVPVEVIETLAPIHVHTRELRADSGGAGRFRGGLGQVMRFEVTTGRPFQLAGLYERIDHPPPGLAGGLPGAAGRFTTEPDAGIPPKITKLAPAGTVMTMAIPGGGGYGDPRDRDVGAVLEDVRAGYVSAPQAQALYGVVVDTAAWRVDEAATARLRRAG